MKKTKVGSILTKSTRHTHGVHKAVPVQRRDAMQTMPGQRVDMHNPCYKGQCAQTAAPGVRVVVVQCVPLCPTQNSQAILLTYLFQIRRVARTLPYEPGRNNLQTVQTG